MALDELHARRLATVINMMEVAIERIEPLLDDAKKAGDLSPFSADQRRGIRDEIESVRRRLEEAAERFGVRPRKPHPRQAIAAELSSLWVILENAMPRRMKGFGREFDPADKADWEKIIRALRRDVDRIREIALKKEK